MSLSSSQGEWVANVPITLATRCQVQPLFQHLGTKWAHHPTVWATNVPTTVALGYRGCPPYWHLRTKCMHHLHVWAPSMPITPVYKPQVCPLSWHLAPNVPTTQASGLRARPQPHCLGTECAHHLGIWAVSMPFTLQYGHWECPSLLDLGTKHVCCPGIWVS